MEYIIVLDIKETHCFTIYIHCFTIYIHIVEIPTNKGANSYVTFRKREFCILQFLI